MNKQVKSHAWIRIPLFGAILLFLMLRPATCQSESIDLVRFTPPASWTVTRKDAAVVLSDTKTAPGAFCVVTISASRSSAGTNDGDFKSEWARLVAVPYQVKDQPKAERQVSDGWTTASAAAPVVIDGAQALALLTVISGYGRSTTILSLLNSNIYLPILDSLMAGVTMTKPAANLVIVPSGSQAGPGSTPGKFGHLMYKPMEGWTEKAFSNALSFQPDLVPPGFSIELRIMQSRPFSGTTAQAFAASWQDALDQLQSVSTAPPSAMGSMDGTIPVTKLARQGWEYMRGEAIISDRSQQLYRLSLFVVKLPERIERIFVVSPKIRGMYGAVNSLDQYGQYSSVFDNFIYSVKFDDWKDKDSSGSITGSGPVGLYAGLKLGDGDLSNGGGLNPSYAAIFSNGQVYFFTKLHSYGFDGLNTQAEADRHGRNWGTLEISGDAGSLVMPYGRLPLRLNAQGFLLTTQNTPHQYVKLRSVDGVRISGTYIFESDRAAKAQPSITFSADGKFIDDGAINVLYHNSTEREELNIAARPGSGTYEARNYSMIFTYTDGRRLQIAFSGLLFDRKDPSPKQLTLSFNNDVMTRR